MRAVGNLLGLGLLIGLGLGIPLLVYLALDAILYGVKVVLSVLAGTGLIVLAYLAILKWRQQDERRRRAVDGSFPLMEVRDGAGGKIYVDLNKSTSGVLWVNPRHGVREWESPLGPDRQLAFAQAVQATRSLAALTPGDQALIATGGMGFGSRPGIANAATGKFLAGGFDPQPKHPPALALPAPAPQPPVARLSLADALAQSTGSRWVVGQSDSGDLAAFEPARHAHGGIVGSTGTGKTTSVGFGMALAAIRAGWHVVIIDPDGGTNWQPFAAYAEWHEADRASFPGQVESIHRLYEHRATASGNPRPVIVFLEEYGDLIRQLRTASRSDADHVDGMLDSILQRGRKRRVHLALIDQYPEHWSQAVIGGTKFRAVFQLGPNQGAKMEEYKAGQLADVGRFLVRGVEYSSFDASAAVSGILRQLPAPASQRRVITPARPTRPAQTIDGSLVGSPGGSFAGSERFAQEVAPPSPAPPEPTEPTGPTDYQRAAAAYVEAFPTCTQTDLRHALGIAKGYAHELWHTYHPKGNKYQLPTGSMDLTNDGDRETFQQLLRSGAVSFPEPKEK